MVEYLLIATVILAPPSRPLSQVRDRHFLYVATESGIEQYRLTPHGRPVPLTPARVAIDGRAFTLKLGPTCRYVYVPECDYFDVAQFRIGRNGALYQLHPFLAHADAHPSDIVFHPSGRFAYVLNSHGSISQYAVHRNGHLVPMQPTEIIVSENGQRDPSDLLFVGRNRARVRVSTTDGAGRIIELIVDKDGRLGRVRPN